MDGGDSDETLSWGSPGEKEIEPTLETRNYRATMEFGFWVARFYGCGWLQASHVQQAICVAACAYSGGWRSARAIGFFLLQGLTDAVHLTSHHVMASSVH